MPEPVSLTPPTQRSAPADRPIRFVESDGKGLPLKRKQVLHACETCRKKKVCLRQHRLYMRIPCTPAWNPAVCPVPDSHVCGRNDVPM